MTRIDLGLGHLRIAGSGGVVEEFVAEYGPAEGLPALREAVAAWEGADAGHVAITTGASLALAATLATLPHGSRVLCPRPYYPAYPRLARAFGLEVLFYSLREDDAWQPDPDEVARLLESSPAAVLWNSPANPTGTLCGAERLNALGALFALRPELLLISDEVYAHFVYGGEPGMLHPPHERTVRIRSFSKVFGLAGERVGYVLAPPALAAAVSRWQWTLAMSPPATGQFRALAALRDEPGARLRELVAQLHEQRDAAAAILSRCPAVCFALPAAGFFHWIRLEGGGDADRLSRACVETAGVVTVPGNAFGADGGAYLRASFAVPPQDMTEGFERLAAFLSTETCRAVERQ